MMSMMKTMGYSFLLLIGMITFMNMANTMILNVITRKRELGVLQAVGMTNKRLNTLRKRVFAVYTWKRSNFSGCGNSGRYMDSCMEESRTHRI